MDLDFSTCKPYVEDSACLSNFLMSAVVTGQPPGIGAKHEYHGELPPLCTMERRKIQAIFAFALAS
ncbi:hypothetical protein PSE10B_51190 [Pseudomonas amygdali pv. eriobotryae]|nr:hypothetical protein PSE10B_51190 [Pseudomonas amygdali pv. eriobotryae]